MFLDVADDPERQHDITIAACYNLISWLAWIGGKEISDIKKTDVETAKPGDSA